MRRKRPNGLTLRQAFFFVMGDGPPPVDQCWLWRGTIRDKGYGCLGHGGKLLRAHRVSYQLFCGPLDDDQSVLHSCPGGDQPACVQPAHLRPGTHLDNMGDAVRAGSYRGASNGRAKLSADDVRAIRAAQGCRAASVAAQFGVSAGQVYRIWRGQSW